MMGTVAASPPSTPQIHGSYLRSTQDDRTHRHLYYKVLTGPRQLRKSLHSLPKKVLMTLDGQDREFGDVFLATLLSINLNNCRKARPDPRNVD
jgi:hypothetical protein